MEAATQSGFLGGSLRKGEYTYLVLLGFSPSSACSPCWKFKNPYGKKLDDETPMPPYIGHSHISDSVRLCRLTLSAARPSAVYAQHQSDSCDDPYMNVAQPPVPSLLQPAALPTELPGNGFQFERDVL